VTFCHCTGHGEAGVRRCLEASVARVGVLLAKGADGLGKAVVAGSISTTGGAEKDGRVVHFDYLRSQRCESRQRFIIFKLRFCQYYDEDNSLHLKNRKTENWLVTKYGAILADPPWSFKAYSGPRLPQRSDHQHYAVESHEDLVALAPKEAADNCALFMWVVDSHLDQGIELMRAWGFEFKTIAFVWVKTCKDGVTPRMGMGLWTRKQSEICIMGTRGKVRRNDKGVRQVIMAPRREHSRKPDQVCRLIERLVDGPYLEMFARQQRPGWDQLGDEVGKFKSPLST
jgi:N6-adenosine-specific RNA methylase IME4